MSDSIDDINMEFTDSAGRSLVCIAHKLAEFRKERGNQLYKNKNYKKAIELYTEAIELYPNSTYYGNRSACYMMLYNYHLALLDAKEAVALDRSFAKGYIRIAKCSLALGDMRAANNAFSAASELSLNNDDILPEVKKLDAVMELHLECKISYEAQDYKRALFCLDRILEHIPCTRYKLQKARCLVLLGQYQEAERTANDVLQTDGGNVVAIYMRGLCLYYQDNIKEAFNHFRLALRLEPNYTEAINSYKQAKSFIEKMERGNNAYKEGNYFSAYTAYTEALKIDPKNDPINMKLFFNRAMVSLTMGHLTDAVADCSSALEKNPNYSKALLIRARCYMDLKDFDKAIKDYKKAYAVDRSPETRKLLEDAELAFRKPKHSNYYSTLGVDKTASQDEIKKAYRKKALIHHPDRHVGASEEKRNEEEKKFKEVGEAFGTLSNPAKRAQYDRERTVATAADRSSAYNSNWTYRTPFTDQVRSQFKYRSDYFTDFAFNFH
jgi:DnaJ family protein C protein 7